MVSKYALSAKLETMKDLHQGCTTQISWRAKKIERHNQGPKLISLTHPKGVYQRNKLNKQDEGLGGPI